MPKLAWGVGSCVLGPFQVTVWFSLFPPNFSDVMKFQLLLRKIGHVKMVVLIFFFFFFFHFSCKKLAVRQFLGGFHLKNGHEANIFTFPAKNGGMTNIFASHANWNWSCDKHSCISYKSLVATLSLHGLAIQLQDYLFLHLPVRSPKAMVPFPR